MKQSKRRLFSLDDSAGVVSVGGSGQQGNGAHGKVVMGNAEEVGGGRVEASKGAATAATAATATATTATAASG